MKRRDLERHGSDHDIWTNGQMSEPIPRHGEVREMLARKIARKMKNNPPEGK